MNQKSKHNYAFIDNQNLNLGIQKLGWKMDWRKFRSYLRKELGVEKAYMFIGYMPENEDLYNQMHDAGYLVVLKPTLEMFKVPAPEPAENASSNGHEPFKTFGERAAESLVPTSADPENGHSAAAQRTVKGNVDVELVLWAVKEMPRYSKAVIISGDGDFYGLIEYLIDKNKLAHLLVPNRQYSTLLRQFDKYIIRLDQKRRQLAYYKRFRKPDDKK
ncbi:MAG TPA: NYN domain-containing protein [Candidatus Saccharimonadales bacterium]|nr:NYN domain-containing protein [Candidatus Saccharimonadales bacterium]